MTKPTAFFRIPPCLLGPSPTPIQKRTGEFATEVDAHTGHLLEQIELLLVTGKPITETFQFDIAKIIQRQRTELAARRERDFFKLVEPHAREGGSGYVATCMVEDWLRAVLLSTTGRTIWDSPVMSMRTMTDLLRLTASRIGQCQDVLRVFTEAQITAAAMIFVDHIGRADHVGLANLMIDNMEQAVPVVPPLLHILQIPPGSWRKTLRDGLADRICKVIDIVTRQSPPIPAKPI